MASMKEKANETSKAPTLSVESVIKSYLTSKLSNNNLTFWVKYSAEGRDCRIQKMVLSNLFIIINIIFINKGRASKRASWEWGSSRGGVF